MKKKILHKLMVIILGIIIFTGCTDNFDDLNTNPDSITKAPPSMLATSVILNFAKFNGRDAMAYFEDQCLVKYVGMGSQKVPNQYNQINRGWFGVTALPTINKMVEMAEGNPQADSYKALAKFARAILFWGGISNFGDIPYSEAGLGSEGNFKPKYDSQEAVLLGILNELKEAETLFAKGINFDGDPTPYAGNAAKWRRAVNAYTLKILMSASKKADTPSLEIKKRFQDIVNSGFILENSTGYLGLVYNTVQLHPIYNNRNLYYNSAMISALVVDELKKNNDYRLFYFADPAPVKTAAGLKEGEMEAYVGCDVSMDYAEFAANTLKKMYSPINGRYYDNGQSEPRAILSFAEQQLILAEARILGWISNSTAKDYYESGVKAALAFYMATPAAAAHGKPITQAYIDSYFTGPAAFAATSADQLKQIWMQRYLLGYMQPQSSFFEYRRTRYPEFPINPTTNLNPGIGGGYPMRYNYPDAEYSYNLDNLKSALQSQWTGVDDTNNIMWILK